MIINFHSSDCCRCCMCRTKGAVVEIDWTEVGDDVDMDVVCAKFVCATNTFHFCCLACYMSFFHSVVSTFCFGFLHSNAYF